MKKLNNSPKNYSNTDITSASERVHPHSEAFFTPPTFHNTITVWCLRAANTLIYSDFHTYFIHLNPLPPIFLKPPYPITR